MTVHGQHGRSWLLGTVVTLCNCTLIVLIAYTLAGISWRLLGFSSTTEGTGDIGFAAAATAAADSGTSDFDTQTANAETIAAWHLFGELETAAPLEPQQAPETRLNLRLAGIFYNAVEQSRAMALIAKDGGVEQRYRAGDELGGGVVIKQIYADKVMLLRNGKAETLTLPRELNHRTAKPALAAEKKPFGRNAGAAGRDANAVHVNAGAVAKRLRQNRRPDSLQDLAFATPHLEDGRFVGLRLKPGRKKRMLTQLGLRSGDVLTELNGTRLTDPAQGAVLLQELLSADQINAKVVRNGAEMPFTFVLNQ